MKLTLWQTKYRGNLNPHLKNQPKCILSARHVRDKTEKQ
jgi:hypothetical protein